jgi:ferredoxin-NADP reductase
MEIEGQRHRVRLAKIIEHTPSTKLFFLEDVEGALFSFVAGQHVLLWYRGSDPRSFSYANGPADAGYVELAIKDVGPVTGLLHHAQVGEEMELEGPRGKLLNFDFTNQRETLYLAGGSGITPVLSQLRYLSTIPNPTPVTVLYSSKHADDIIYRDVLDHLARTQPWLHVIYTLTESIPSDWMGERGRIDAAMIARSASDPAGMRWYFCGPPSMGEAMHVVADQFGVSPEERRFARS